MSRWNRTGRPCVIVQQVPGVKSLMCQSRQLGILLQSVRGTEGDETRLFSCVCVCVTGNRCKSVKERLGPPSAWACPHRWCGDMTLSSLSGPGLVVWKALESTGVAGTPREGSPVPAGCSAPRLKEQKQRHWQVRAGSALWVWRFKIEIPTQGETVSYLHKSELRFVRGKRCATLSHLSADLQRYYYVTDPKPGLTWESIQI